MKKGKIQSIELSALKPKRLYPSEFAEKGKIVVLVPKQQTFVEWFIPRKKIVNERVKLDILGSFVWNNCDGNNTVKDIAERMKQEYGGYAEPIDTKVGQYIRKLQENRLIDVVR